MAINNPFLDELKQFKHFQSVEQHRQESYDYAQVLNWDIERYNDEIYLLKYRDKLRQKYSYAIPCEEAIDVICEYSPIMEIGSGTGYWANLIAQKGGDIIAMELDDKENPYFDKEQIGSHYPVKLIPENKEILSVPDVFSLFLCWPPYDTDMAYKYINAYRGNILIYIGEGEGGCTANDQFFNVLENQWKLERTVFIPQFPGIHDYLAIYRRIIK